MDSLVDAVEAADSVWAVVAIALIGIYVLLWRYGGKLLDLLSKNTTTTNEAKEIALSAHATAARVEAQLKTNHGSESLGHAVDMLTEAITRIDERGERTESVAAQVALEAAETRSILQKVAEKLDGHLHQADVTETEVLERLHAVEHAQAVGGPGAPSA